MLCSLVPPVRTGRVYPLAVAALLLQVLPYAHAQQERGSIVGTVTDPTGAVLQGAQVQLAPQQQTVTTDEQGRFSFTGVQPGTSTLTIRYLGFAPYSTQVTVAPGAPTLTSAVLRLSDASNTVTVTAEREVGEAEALNRQRAAVNIQQVLPSEVINSLPNVNIADAVGRMPSVSLERDEGEGKYIQIRGTEPRLNNVTIDGVQVPSPENVRNVKLDTIPAGLVESIEVNKTLTANMNADGIGGSVNLVSRTATDVPYFAIEGLLGHTPIGGNGGRGEDQLLATYGRRFGAGKRWGLLGTGSYDWNGRGINDIEPSAAVNPIVDANGNQIGSVNAPSEIDLRDYYYDRSRYGAGGTLDYRLGENSTAYLKGLYSYFNDYGENSIYSLTAGTFTSPTTTDNTGSVQYSDNYRRPTQEIWSLNAGAHQEHGENYWNYRAALSQAALTGGSTYSTFGGPQGVQFNVTQQDPFTPQFTVQNGVNIYDPSQYALSGLTFQDNHTHERDAMGEASFGRRYISRGGATFGSWETGFKIRDVVKSQVYQESAASAGPPLLLASVLGPHTDPDYYFGRYSYGPMAKATRILSFYQQNQTQFSLDTEPANNLPNDWAVNERVYAGYGMNTIDLHRFRINTGLRVEATTENVRGNQLNASDNSISPLHQSNSYTFVLPSVGVQYNFNELSDVRFAYSIGIARPNYGDLAPYLTFDPSAANTAANPALTAGNPRLKATWAHNIDLLGEHYFQNVGLIQGGAFYKMLYDYIASSIQQVSYTAPGASAPATYFESAPLNIGAAHLIGVEASWEQHLTKLPGPLAGTGFRANYSYTASVAGYPGRSDHPTLERTAPSNWNFDATYDRYNLSARMGLTHNDAYLWQYAYQDGTPVAGAPTTPTPGGIAGPASDTYIYPHTQVDAQVSYLLPHGRGFSVVAQFLNLNNEVFGFYNGSEQYPIQREYYKPTYSFGLRWTQRAAEGVIFQQ